ncbi:hypothetical protein PsYK624_147360 [Phanerochaete sordida]|uniref:Restriction of telomere capping protein 4 n=1 Tax=Phanerochaete sordida TaxID=48140 RepID=A0A9P3GQI1_9APHY|nr:hypothetical protein PsYK624_147360 [Phanerochaete sordida]
MDDSEDPRYHTTVGTLMRTIEPKDTCGKRGCLRRLGLFRVHQGSTPESRHRKGAIAQTCSSWPECHWTICHTDPLYENDAELIVQQLNEAQEKGDYVRRLPDEYKPRLPLLRLPPPAASQGNASQEHDVIYCTTPGCKTRKGARTRGNKLCPDVKCPSCCKTAFEDACRDQRSRVRCVPHKTSALVYPPSHLLPHAPSTTTPANSLPSMTEVPPADPPTATASRRAPSRRVGNLSQPMDPEWAEQRGQAEVKRLEAISRRQQSERLVEQRKKMCTFVIWYENGQQPLVLSEVVDSYPNVALRSIAKLAALNLDTTSVLEYWNGEWILCGIETPLTVDTDHALLLRTRPTLTLQLADCPGLEDRLETQVKRRGGIKRRAPLMTSPVKKMARAVQDLSIPRLPALRLSPVPSRSVSPSPFPTSSRTTPRPRSPSLELLQSPPLRPAPLAPVAGALPPTALAARAWPKDFTVREIVDGFRELERLFNQGQPNRLTFVDVFHAPYVKATVTRHKAYLKKVTDAAFIDIELHGDWKWSAVVTAFDRKQPLDDFASSVRGDSVACAVADGGHEHVPSACEAPAPGAASASQSAPTAADASHTRQDGPTGSENDSQPVAPAPFPVLSPLHALSPRGNTPPILSRPVSPLDLSEFFPDITQPLCEFCDEPMTGQPSAVLQTMRAKLLPLSWSSPTINPAHRAVENPTVCHQYCERHELETTQLPLAQAAGWPLAPNFSRLYHRLLRLRVMLAAVLKAETPSSEFLHAARARYGKSGGANAAEAPQAQYASFGEADRVRTAGYYGNEGLQIIQYTLMNMFDASDCDISSFEPLRSFDAILREVLVPEAITLLIQADMQLSRTDAITTLFASQDFGALMHPAHEASADFDAVQAHHADIYRRVLAEMEAEEAAPSVLEYWNADTTLGYEEWVQDTQQQKASNTTAGSSDAGVRLKEEEVEAVFASNPSAPSSTLTAVQEGDHVVYILDD